MNNSELSTKIEHINLTVRNPNQTADQLAEIFGWQHRWSGPSLDGGDSLHVGVKGNGNSYMVLYTHSKLAENNNKGHLTIANLNHVGIVVSDLDEVERRVIEQGLKTFNHADYEPGRRFYFYLEDNIEIEVISYAH